jgi:hypothetical protein
MYYFYIVKWIEDIHGEMHTKFYSKIWKLSIYLGELWVSKLEGNIGTVLKVIGYILDSSGSG